MKKKRFIKLFMSRGFSRNEARERAQSIVYINEGFSNYNKIMKAEGSPDRFRLETYSGEYEGTFL